MNLGLKQETYIEFCRRQRTVLRLKGGLPDLNELLYPCSRVRQV